MLNEPEKWVEQRWVVPARMLTLVRDHNRWVLQDCDGANIVVPDRMGEYLSTKLNATIIEEDWIDRHSLQFRWLRFWYQRKKKREARQKGKS